MKFFLCEFLPVPYSRMTANNTFVYLQSGILLTFNYYHLINVVVGENKYIAKNLIAIIKYNIHIYKVYYFNLGSIIP